MKVPFKYSIHNFGSRKLTTAITILGIALVVFVFSAVLMMAYGINKTLATTGSDNNVVVIRKGSNGEISSIVDGDAQNIIKTLPYIAKKDNGRQILTASPVVVINLSKPDGGVSNVMVRGMDDVISDLHPEVKITQGRMFNPSLRELIVGASISDKFTNADIGSQIKFAGDQWKIVGKFT
ncbi:MAG: ABC transporter permease, partial [Calditrichaeota bacterium]|nr:ABC transporter permease [Calditrichota bacterium]